MDLQKVLADLKKERATLEEAILTLERLARGSGKRRGRPPRWMSEIGKKAEEKTPARRGRKPKDANA